MSITATGAVQGLGPATAVSTAAVLLLCKLCVSSTAVGAWGVGTGDRWPVVGVNTRAPPQNSERTPRVQSSMARCSLHAGSHPKLRERCVVFNY